MRDLKAAWQRWSQTERIVATVFSIVASVATPALYLNRAPVNPSIGGQNVCRIRSNPAQDGWLWI